jgi:hypothetical protein
MRVACKCKNCGHIEMSAEDDVTFEIDFLDERIVYICRQCKHNNTMSLKPNENNRPPTALPRISVR